MKRLIEIIKRVLIRNKCYFIGSTDKLLPPLKPEEELDLARRKMIGDERAREKLIEQSLCMCYNIIKFTRAAVYIRRARF